MCYINTYDTATAAAAYRTQRPTFRVAAEAIGYGARGPVYRVTYAGEVLIEACRCPLFDSCRALLARGITGRLESWRPGKATFDTACDVLVGRNYLRLLFDQSVLGAATVRTTTPTTSATPTRLPAAIRIATAIPMQVRTRPRQRAGAKTTEFAASHVSMLSQPHAVLEVIRNAASAVAAKN
jgi:hypothetical protein